MEQRLGRAFLAFVSASRAVALTACLGLAGAGCSNDAKTARIEPDASAGAGAAFDGPSRAVAKASDLVGGDELLRKRLAPTDEGWQRSDEGIVSPGWRGASKGPAHDVGARLPDRADGTIEAGIGRSEPYRLRLTPEGAKATPLSLDRGRASYEHVYDETDVVWIAESTRVEWMYVIHGPAAPRTYSTKVELPANLRAPTPEPSGGLVFRDEAGHAELTMPRPVLFDANGVRREADLAWEGGKIVVRYAAEGLAYPLLLDPALWTGVWEQKPSPPDSRVYHGMTYDAARGYVVVFGGLTYHGPANDTWWWNGGYWSLIATTGPAPRYRSPIVYDPVRQVTVMYGGTDGTSTFGDTWESPGGGWNQVCTSAPCSTATPGPRSGHSLAWDPVLQKVVLFGGTDGTTAQGDTWAWNGTAWTKVATIGPSARSGHVSATDLANNRIVIFGGNDGVSQLDDTWAWNGSSWSRLFTASGYVCTPLCNIDPIMAYDVASSRVFLLAGWNGANSYNAQARVLTPGGWVVQSVTNGATAGVRYGGAAVYHPYASAVVQFGGAKSASWKLGDTWQLDGVANAWSSPPTQMQPRALHEMAYDEARSRTVAFGGQSGLDLNDTWEYVGLNWQPACTSAACIASSPSVRQEAPMTWVGHLGGVAVNKVLLFGGMNFTGGVYNNELWAYDGTAWTQLCTTAPCSTSKPSARSGSAFAWDPGRSKLVLFGGLVSGTANAETWEFDGTQWTQVCTTAPCSSSVPAPRNRAGFVYDADRGHFVLFGGLGVAAAPFGDTWEWDGTAWTQVCTTAPCSTSTPAARNSAGFSYDSVRGISVLSGGRAAGAGTTVYGDTWEWIEGAWLQVSTPAPPNARWAHTQVFDKARQRTIVYGGSASDGKSSLGDTWEYHARGNGCGFASACDTAFCVDGVCCESISCGTCQSCATTGNPGVCAAVVNGDDVDTCTGNNTCDALGVCKKKLGQSCALGTECASSFCADGYCCNAACAGGCDQCATTPGTCTTLAAGTLGSNPSCGGYLCNGSTGSCPLTCTADADCKAGYFCAAGGVCQPQHTQGVNCNTAAGGDCLTAGCRECSTGTCKDGYCCNIGCTAACQTCAGASPGTCTSLTSGDDLDTCTGINTCNAAGACMLKVGQGCTAGAQCASGFCSDGFCCSGACTGGCDVCSAALGAPSNGACTTLAQGSAGTGCGSYVCNGSQAGCPTICGNDADCAAGTYCDATGHCATQKPQGNTCNPASGADCKSAGCRVCGTGNCIDGYCCNSACGNACDACNGAALGWSGATNGTCKVAPVGYAGSPSCGAYACDGTSATCATICAADAQCGASYYCAAGGACLPRRTQGQSCNLVADCKASGCRECATGNCADGYCCDSACNASCKTCASAPGTCTSVLSADDPDTCSGASTCTSSGGCAKKTGQSCTLATECASGFCADGYCCNSACAGGCDVCSATPGTCTVAAKGTAGVSPVCAPFLCDGANASCPGSCAVDADCVTGTYCDGTGHCTTQKAQGAACNASAGSDCKAGGCRVCATGNCVDGFCCNTACAGSCDACNGATLGWSGATNGTCKVAPVSYVGNPGCVAYSCDGSSASCPSTCASDTQCGAGYYCTPASVCAVQKTQGQSCNLATDCKVSGACRECVTGNCVDGFCCSSACAGACDLCSATPGTCTLASAGAAGTPGCSPYLCNGSSASCASACTADSQCASGFYCRLSDGTCQAVQDVGGACATGAQCKSTLFCVDGFCCNAACNGLCQACSAVKTGGSNGTCGSVTAGSDPDNECPDDGVAGCQRNGFCSGSGACQLYSLGSTCAATTCANASLATRQCNGLGTCASAVTACPSSYACASASACVTKCAADGDCVAGYWCRLSDGACQPAQALGAACATASQCATSNCVDGVCCDTTCSGQCQACTAALKGSGSDGTCGSVKVGTDPQNECADDGAASCQKNGVCSGTGTCQLYPSGVTCGTTTCTGTTQTGYACDGLGACKSGSTSSCAPYACGATACLSTCSADAQCVATSWCRTTDGTCQADQATGASCTASSQCQSGNCVDGLCCDSPCNGLCQACSAAKKGTGAGTDGTCGPVKASTDPDNECTSSAASTCQQDGNCDGAGACKLWVPGTVCGATTCGNGTQTGYACDGFGVCKAGNTTSCSPYTCSGNACGTTCADDAGCIAADYCRTSDGTCQAAQASGAACTTTRQCATGNCVDGFCCDSPCNGLCQACSVAKKGAGANGTCGNVAADSDPDNECTTDATSTCKQTGFCSGLGTCKLYPGGTTCAATTCASGAQTGYACDGSGTCKAGTAAGCAPYTCADTVQCATTCTTDGQCVATSWCRISDGKCVPDQSNGAACSSATQCVSGNCVDGVCCDTSCNGLCQACTAALKGGGADGACGNVAVATDPQNECADDGAASCQRDGMCNGAGSCRLYPSGVTCGATTCSGTTQTGYACDGLGACKAAGTTACSPYTCGATACLSSCNGDSQCVVTSFCRSSDGTCQPDQAAGASCASASQCASGNCVDGLCCDSPCNGLCQACSAAKKGSGANGVCGSVKVDSDPDNECTAAAASTCQLNGSCDGNGACKLWALGTVCGATTCGNGTQNGYQCDGFGGCKAGNATACAPYACSGNQCGTTCADDSGCIIADWCRTSDGSCQPDQGNGAACSSSTQCASGNCVDGVCCDAPCNGLCQACSAAKKGSGASGACGAIAVDSDPDSECATDATSTCKQTGSCDGAGACKRYPLGTTCGSTTCASGVQTGYQCDGFGTCNAGAATNCAPYTCADATSCATACASDTACVTSAYCDASSGTCKSDQKNGAVCSSASQCISGFCVDGVCCDQACGGQCQACTAVVKGAGTDGVCGMIAKGADPQSECPDDGVSTCQRDGFCNGAGACDLYAAGAACGASTCTAGTQTGYACNGLGTCATSSTTNCAPYVCSGSACGATCAGDGDCIAASFCRVTDQTCQPDQAGGSACTSATQCASGNCVDGVCCDAPCGGTCQACTAAKKGSGADGVCESVKAGTDPDNECNDDGTSSCQRDGFCSGSGACRLYGAGVACGSTACLGGTQTGYACDGAGTCNPGQTAACAPYLCNGGSCGLTCASDADCVAAAYCSAASQCVPDQANGAACTTASQCTSGFCTDGVCCDQACGGTCQACSAAKKGGASQDGVCGAVKVGTDPDNECAVDSPTTCLKDGQCDGKGECRLYSQGTGCGQNTCSGASLTGQQCDGLGACVPGQSSSCAPFLCVGASCAISCADDGGCVATAYCGNNLCNPKVDNAAACVADHECKSGFCVEGLCCNTACDGICQACTAANKAAGVDGVCGDAKAAVDPHGDCADDGAASCLRDGTCDGAGACRLYAAGVACGATNCVANVQTGYACSGTGTCNADATTDCGLYACNAGQCQTSCVADASCSAAAYCDTASSACKPKDADGAACAGASTCASGYCVDGVCCDQACGGQCEACDVSTAKGKCSPVAGKPHGSRPACAGATGSTPNEKCGARACDGPKSTASCVGYVGSEIACRDESCTKGQETFSGTCNGLGQCGAGDAQMVRNCEPFACGATACKDKCGADADCAPGYKCDVTSGKCISGATCDGDHTITAPGQPATDCRPYKCEAGGTCKASCGSVDDCAAGYVCAEGLCSTATTSGGAAADEGGGCGCQVPGTSKGAAGAWASLALLAIVRLRRTRGRGRRGESTRQ